MELDAAAQLLLDAKLAKAWSGLHGGADAAATVAVVGGAPPSAGMRSARTSASSVDDGAASHGMPATKDELEAYGQRVLRPGVVQSHGVCLLLGRDNNPKNPGAAPVLAVSTNALHLLGVPPEQVLGVDLLAEGAAALLAPASAAAIRAALAGADLSVVNPLPVVLNAPGAAAFDGILHGTPEGVMLDLEPACSPADWPAGGGAGADGGALRAHALARASVARLQGVHTAAGVQPLCEAMVEEVRALTGYDRCMVYMFHDDEHGEVVAESAAPGGHESWLGLHFPSTDIPQANRVLFLQLRSRLIADVEAEPCTMLQAASFARPVQLGASQLRGITGCHAEYLRNMGVAGSLVLALVTHTAARASSAPRATASLGAGGAPSPRPAAAELRLWGLCVCHSYAGARFVPYALRSATEFLLQVFSLQLGVSIEAAARQRAEHISRTEAALYDALTRAVGPAGPAGGAGSSTPGALAALAACTEPGLCDLVDASGAAAVQGRACWRAGAAPPPEDELLALVAWLEARHAASEEHPEAAPTPPSPAYVTHSLHADGYPRAAEVRTWAAGVLAVRVPPASPPPRAELYDDSSEEDDEPPPPPPPPVWLLWFRREALREVRWAGDTSAPQGRLQGAAMLPRASFAAFVQRVELAAFPWRPAEAAAARALQRLLADSALLGLGGGGDGSGLTTRLLTRLNDERLRAVEELQALASELTEVVHAAHVPMLALDVSGRLIEWNDRMQALTRRPRDAVLGTPLTTLLLPRCTSRATAAFAAALAGTAQKNVELCFSPLADSAADGGSAPADAEADVVTVVYNVARRRGAGGVAAGLVLVGHDVSEQRRLAAHCSRVTADLSLLVDHAAAPVFGTDASGHVNAWNAAMARATGVERGEVLGSALVGHVFGARGRLKLASEEQRVALEVALQSALRGAPAAAPVALTCGLRDGRLLELVLSIDPRRDDDGQGDAPGGAAGGDAAPSDGAAVKRGAVRGTFCFAQDVGLRKALEQATAVRATAEAAAQAKNRQLAMLCHEIRNPLNGILGTVAALDEESTDPAVAELVSTTLTCSNQLRRTIDQMLDWSKLEEGKLTLELEPFSVRATVRAVIAQIQRAASEKGLVVVADLRGVTAPLPGCFVGDACRVQQILANFAWNSCKFTQSGSITIRVDSEETSAAPDAPRRVFFRVIDTGVGMDADAQAKLFQPYEMAHPSRIGKYGGSGLGLNICQALAKLLGGTVHCISSPGMGTTFVLQLTMDVAPELEAPQHEPDAPADAAGADGGGGAQQLRHASETAPWRPHAPSPPGAWGDFTSSLPPPPPQPQQQFAAPSRLDAALARVAAIAAAAAPWQMRVVRELVDDAEVVVLAELSAAGHVRQAWGAAPRAIGSSIGAVLAAATTEAVTAAAALFGDAPAGGFVASQHAAMPSAMPGAVAATSPYAMPTPPVPRASSSRALGARAGERYAVSPPRMNSSWPSSGALAQGGGSSRGGLSRLASQVSLGSRPPSPQETGRKLPTRSSSQASFPTQGVTSRRPSGGVGMGGGGGTIGRCASTSSLERVSLLGSAPNATLTSAAFTASAGALGAPPVPGLLRRVLAVDDEPVNLRLVKRFLEKEGVEVVMGEDGHDLVDIMVKRGERFDVVLLDEHMRRMNGSPAAVLLRNYETEHGLLPTPVLATTGNASAHDVRMYASSGFDGLIVKPVNLSDLASSLRDYLEVRQHMPGVGCAGAVWVQTDPARVQLRLDDTRHFGGIQVFGPP